MNNRFAVALVVASLLLAGLACRPGIAQPPAAPAAEPGAASPAVTVTPDTAKLVELQDEVRLLGMLNRLQLTADEINKLLPPTEKLAQQRAQALAELAGMQSDLEKLVAQKRDLLLADKPVPDGLDNQIGEAQNHQEAAQEQAAAKLADSAKALRPLFTSDQLDIVAGRYEARLQARELLDWLRGLSDNDFSEEAGSNAEGLADPDQGFSKEALTKLFAAVRKLTPAQYDQQRDTYAQQLAPLYGASGPEENQQIAGAFSDPHMADLLRAKLKVIGGGAG
jgi:small-conductance mechanosensitive channel